jgi:hypothetical protein
MVQRMSPFARILYGNPGHGMVIFPDAMDVDAPGARVVAKVWAG